MASLLLASGCQHFPPYKGPPTLANLAIVLPDNATDDDVRGCEIWSVEGVTCLRSGPGDLKIVRLPGCGEDGDTLAQTSYTRYDKRQGLLEIFACLDQDDYVETIAHEIGHWLGIGHLSDGNLMAPGQFAAPYVTTEDHDALVDVVKERGQ